MDQLALPLQQLPDMSDEYRAVWGLILSHRGHEQAISVSRISEATGLSGRTVRAIVDELVVRHRKPIGSTSRQPAGFFVVETAEDLEASAHLHSRAMSLLVRWSRLTRTTAEDLAGQVRMELERMGA